MIHTLRDMYFSVDIETDGNAPGVSSMLSIGVVALDPSTLEETGSFYRTLKRLPEATPRNDTMEWWDGFPEKYVEARKNAIEPKQAMQELHDFVVEQCKRAKRQYDMERGPLPVFVAYPAGFDFSFVYYYMHRFLGECIFSFSALDMKSYAMGMLGVPFTKVGEKSYPEGWITAANADPHQALADARHQAAIFVNSLRWWQKNKELMDSAFAAQVELDKLKKRMTHWRERAVIVRDNPNAIDLAQEVAIGWLSCINILSGATEAREVDERALSMPIAGLRRCVVCDNGAKLGELNETCDTCGRRGGDHVQE